MLTTGAALLGLMCRRAACQSARALIHQHPHISASQSLPSSTASCFSSFSRILSSSMHSSASSLHGGGGATTGETVMIVFVDKEGVENVLEAPIGKSLLEVAHDNEIELEGACEGSLACSTCHVIVEVKKYLTDYYSDSVRDTKIDARDRLIAHEHFQKLRPVREYVLGFRDMVGRAVNMSSSERDEDFYKRMPEPCDDELDMLDLAFALTATSRLGCQIIVSKELEGLRVRVPSASRNFYVDGHKPKPH